MAGTYERIRIWLLLIWATGQLVLGGVAAYACEQIRKQIHLPSAADSSISVDWGIPAAALGLVGGLVLVVSAQAPGPRFSILDRVLEWMVWLVLGALAITTAALVLRVPFGIPQDAALCAGVGLFLLCLSFVRPMLARADWWKQLIWAGAGAVIGAIAAELAWVALFLSRTRLGPEAGTGILVAIFAAAPFGLLLGAFAGFYLSRRGTKGSRVDLR
jgi:hypothetical protein